MNKMYLAKKAKELYQIEHLNADEIAKRLGISRRTVFNWIKQFEWKKPMVQPLQLHELQQTASAMLKSIEQDKEGKLTKGTINEMVKFIDYVLKEERNATMQKETATTPKGLTPEMKRHIQKDILGMSFDDE